MLLLLLVFGIGEQRMCCAVTRWLQYVLHLNKIVALLASWKIRGILSGWPSVGDWLVDWTSIGQHQSIGEAVGALAGSVHVINHRLVNYRLVIDNPTRRFRAVGSIDNPLAEIGLGNWYNTIGLLTIDTSIQIDTWTRELLIRQRCRTSNRQFHSTKFIMMQMFRNEKNKNKNKKMKMKPSVCQCVSVSVCRCVSVTWG